MSRDDLVNKSWLNASTFRIILSVSLILIIILTSLGFAYAHQLLGKYADEISHKKVDASTSDETISSLQKVQQTIEQNQGLIDKINTLRADDSFPEFMIVDQIKTIAKRNDIKISSYTFGGTSEEATTGGASTQPTAGQQPATTAPTASGDTVSLTINFGTVPSYRKYLQFIYDIEQNVPKMRIKGVGISGGKSGGETTDGSDPNNQQQSTNTSSLTVDPLVVEMYKK